MITRFGDLFLLLSFFILNHSFSQPVACSPNTNVTGAIMNFNGASMFSPSASPFWNQGGAGVPGILRYNLCRGTGNLTINVTNLPAGYTVAWYKQNTTSGGPAWPGLPPIYLGTGNSWTEPVPAFDNEYMIVGYYYNTSSGCVDRSGGIGYSPLGCIGGIALRNYGNGSDQLSSTDFNPNPACEGDPITFSTSSGNPNAWNTTYRRYLYDNPSYTGTPQLLSSSFTKNAGTYYGTLSIWPNEQCLVTLPPAILVVNPKPNNPSFASATPSHLCLGGNSTLSGSCPSGTVVWFNNSNGIGSPIPGGSSPVVSPSWTETYYAFCDDGVCLSNDNLAVTVNVYDPTEQPFAVSASPTTGCNSYLSNLSGFCNTGGVLRWYNSPSGVGAGLSDPLLVTSSQTVYARCFYSSAPPSCQYSAPSNPINLSLVSPPSGANSISASPNSGCIPFSTTLSGSCSQGIIRWYNNASDTGTGISSNQLISSTGPTTFYAKCYDSGLDPACAYTLSPNSVIVNGYTEPNLPTSLSASPSLECVPYNTILSGTCAQGTIRWYNSPTGTGAGLGSNPSVSSTGITKFYARCLEGANPSGCQYSPADSVSVIGVDIPNQPTLLGTGSDSLCANFTTNLSGSCAQGTIRWYNSPFGTGAGLSMPHTVSNSQTVYARCFDSGNPFSCQYSLPDSLQLTVIPEPSSPTSLSTSNNNECVGYTTNLSGTCSNGILRWYLSPTGTGTGLSMPYTVNNNHVVYARCWDSVNPPGCEYGQADSVLLTVVIPPSIPTNLSASPSNGCISYTSVLSGNCTTGIIRWYNSPFGTGAGLSMPVSVDSTNITFYAKCYEASHPLGCEYSIADSITLSITYPVNVIITGPNTVCVNTSSTYISSHNPGTWFIASGGISANINPSTGTLTSTNTPGPVTIGVSYPNGPCTDTGYLNINVIPPTIVTLNDTSHCFGTTIQLTPSLSGGIYTILSGTGTVSPSGVFSNSSPGVTVVEYNITTGCPGSDTATIITHALPVTPNIGVPSLVDFCQNSSVTLVGNCSGSTIHWYDNNAGIGSPVITGSTVNYTPITADTLFAFCYDSITTCQSDNYDSVIFVELCPDTIISTVPSNGCGDTVILSTPQIDGINYINTCDGSGLTANGDSLTFLNDSTLIFVPYSYPFTRDSACIVICNSSVPICDTTIIYFGPDTTMPPISIPTVVCYDDTIYINSTGVGVVIPDSVADADYQCFDGALTLSRDLFYCDDTGVHQIWVYATNSWGVRDSCLTNITVLDTTKPTIACPSNMNDTVYDICEYIIPDFSNLATDNCDNSLYIYQNPLPGTVIDISLFGGRTRTETINIYATDGSNNIDSCSFDISLLCSIDFRIPQFISPNGDGQNDTWHIDYIELYPNSNVRIYNRWGTLVYQMKNYDNSWNGIPNMGITPLNSDGVLPNGIYYYLIEKGDGEQTYTGYLYIRY